jgi:hypothetical protein
MCTKSKGENMDELVELIQEKTGISKTQASQAVDVVVKFLKDKLPKPIGGQLDAVLKNEDVMGQVADVAEKGLGALGGLLNKKDD